MVNFTNNQNTTPGSMPPPPGAVTPQQAQKQVSGIEELLINYNKKFKNGIPAKYRDKEIFNVIAQLMMSQKSCSLLTGAPGTGKTKLVEEIARLIANQSPYTSTLNDYVVYELPLTNLMSGTSYRGQLEEKVKELIEYCENEKVILFIDEIHQLVGERSSYDGIAQMLKPAMARGSIKMIGATTLQESKNLLDDPAFSRRFNKVHVCELSIDQTREIIKEVYIPKMSSFYGIGFAKDIENVIVKAAEKSKTITCHRPDNAITMLDQICANVLLQRNYNIATCTDDALRQTMQSTPLVINSNHVDNFNKDLTFAIPDNFDSVKDTIFFRDNVIDKLYKTLSDYVKVNALFPDKKPFVLKIKGDAKSGKTTLAKEIATLIDEQPVVLDLADYSDSPSLNRIIGSPLGFVGSDSKKEMPFDIIESNPRKIIILDNIDMCHQVISDFFHSAIDTALIKYADNRMIDISKCIIITTEVRQGGSKNIGFADTKKLSESTTEVTLSVLTKDEMIKGCENMIRNMICELKQSHTKYNTLPDAIDLSDDDKDKIVSATDMSIVAKNIILEHI